MTEKRVISPNEYGMRLSFALTILDDLLGMEIPGGMKGTGEGVGGTYETDPVVPKVEEAFYTVGHARTALRELLRQRIGVEEVDDN